MRTVPQEYQVHSLHCYFLVPGDNQTQIVYRVEKIRTGKTYATRFGMMLMKRSVIATQKGKNIFSAMVSFSVPEVSQFAYQRSMPKVQIIINL
jgi:acyl-CoA thioesterase-2